MEQMTASQIVDSRPALDKYRDTICYDWSNMTDHVAWLQNASDTEIIAWAKTVEGEPDLALREECVCAICGRSGIVCDTPDGAVLVDGCLHTVANADDLILCASAETGKPICDNCVE